jgi:agmatinase
MSRVYPNQFIGLAPCALAEADAVLLPVPFERTVSYGTGTWRAPQAILDASNQLEEFDEETLIEFGQDLRVHTADPVLDDEEESVEQYLAHVASHARQLRDHFVVGLGGEHSVSYGLIDGLCEDLSELTIVQIDAHTDLRDTLGGKRWSHGTVMRRLLERGCRLVQIGVRSVSKEEYTLSQSHPQIQTFFARNLEDRWIALEACLAELSGEIYLSLDVDGLDPSVIPTTGTPQPGGLSWQQTVRIIRQTFNGPNRRVIGADVVEYVASPHPPGADTTAAKLVAKILAHWAACRKTEASL